MWVKKPLGKRRIPNRNVDDLVWKIAFRTMWVKKPQGKCRTPNRNADESVVRIPNRNADEFVILFVSRLIFVENHGKVQDPKS